MKSLYVGIVAIAVTLSGLMAQAQTADDIISKHIDALGGKEKIAAIKTVYTEYDLEIMGTTAPGVSYMINGKGYRNELDLAGQKMIQCVTDKGGWMINPMMGQTSPEPLPEDQVKAGQTQFQAGGTLYDYAAKGYKVELLGTESINGADAHKLKLTVPDVSETVYLIDPNTYHIVKATVKSLAPSAGGMETVMTFSNFKKSEFGYVIPGTTEITMPQVSMVINVNKIEINKEIDPKLFEME